MKSPESITSPEVESISWETLEDFIRLRVQALVQELLEEEAEAVVGRKRYERRKSGQQPIYRNGYGKPRRVSVSCGTIQVRRPRIRNLSEQFESRVLPLFRRQSQRVKSVMPELYLHGLALRDFDMALRGLLGEGAPLSSTSIARLKEHWQDEFDAWRAAPIEDELVYLWADGIYVRAGLEKDKAAVLVAIGVFTDGSKRVLAVEPGFRESKESWKDVFEQLMARGVNEPRAVIADGGLGLWAALAELGWECLEQRCWNHKICNVRDALPRREQDAATALLKKIPYADTAEQAAELRDGFLAAYEDYPKACAKLSSDWNRMVAFFELPREHWRSLRTTNVVESPFQVVRLRTGAARRFKRIDNATAAIWKLLMIAECNFRIFDAKELLEDVARGCEFVNGLPKNAACEDAA